MSAGTAQAYDSAVAGLKAQLRERPGPAAAAAPAPSDSTDRGEGGGPVPGPRPPASARSELLAGPGAGGGGGERLDAASREALASQGLAQEALTDELAVLAASLKANTQAMERKVLDRGRLLDDTETAMDKSMHGVRTAHASAQTIHRKCAAPHLGVGGWGGMWQMGATLAHVLTCIHTLLSGSSRPVAA